MTDGCVSLSVRETQIRHLTLKTYFTAEREDLFPHISDDIFQGIRAEMRFLIIHNTFLCTELHKGFQHISVSSVFIFYQSV